MTSCTNCGVSAPAGARFCKSCGTPVKAQAAPATALPCSGCGTELAIGAKFCRKCGTRPTGTEAPPADTPAPDIVATAGLAPVPAQTFPISDTTPEVASPAGTTAAREIAPVLLPIDAESARPASSPTSEAGTCALATPSPTEPAPRHPSKVLVAAGIAAAVAVGGGGLFWWYSGKQSSTPVGQETPLQASRPTPAAEATVAAQPSEPARPVQPTEPQAEPAQPEPGADVAPALPPPPLPTTQPAVVAAAPTLPAPTAPVKPVVRPNPMEAKIDELLRKAKAHVAKGQFDKAIATAESVLAIDSGNRAARSLISNAKSRQMEALRSNTTLE